MIEKEQARRIVDEVVTYFLSHDCPHITTEMSFEKTGFRAIIAGTCPEEPSDLAVFAEMLNTPRDIALESYYIELLGGHQSIHEEKDFYLLGLPWDLFDEGGPMVFRLQRSLDTRNALKR